MNKIKICLTDDSEMFCLGVKSILDLSNKYEVTMTSSSHELFNLLKQTQEIPKLLLLDIKLKRSGSLNGLEIARELRLKYPSIKIIILTSYDEKEILKSALEVGVDGFLPKEAVSNELLEAIECVLNNQNYMGKTIPFQSLGYAFNKQNKKIESLTKTEYKVFIMVCQSYSNAQIAENLNVSIHTIETHRSNIKSKLSLKNDIDYIRTAIDENIDEVLKFYKIEKH